MSGARLAMPALKRSWESERRRLASLIFKAKLRSLAKTLELMRIKPAAPRPQRRCARMRDRKHEGCRARSTLARLRLSAAHRSPRGSRVAWQRPVLPGARHGRR